MSDEIRAIIFDMDETLLDRDATMLRFLRLQYESFNLGSAKEEFSQAVLAYQLGGYGSKLDAYKKACADTGYTEEQALCLFDDFIENYGDDSVLIDGVKEVLEVLRGKVLLGMVTNGRSRSQRAKIKGAGLDKFFDVIKVSEEEGVEKPASEIFRRCVEELGCSAEEALFVGDHPLNDVAGPNAFGMKTVWVKTKRYQEAPSADLEVVHIKEIFEGEGVKLFGVSL